ncbi:LuxR C-terminal-related transcriptional regulator [Actinoplanes aureus]|uniref:LuxR C-terminal-related transcriptional regulator n=1 Tax=Actinoplanes aureus TaxID=2792083 RepID=UPI001E57C8C4|nr:LuxR C-terminal-related transcriptional regulator [Actinoplanes aureus]
MREIRLSGLSISAAAGRVVRPRVPQGVLWRARLAEALDAGVRRAVTMLCAGPGWGKTALVSSWAGTRSLSGPIAWLTLDAQHDDPLAFWSDLILSLRTAGAIPPTNSIPEPPPQTVDDDRAFRRAFTAALAGLPAVTVVVLDDLHRVTDSRVLGGLADLLADLPERLRFVLISRTEPAVPLHRLRAAGHLTELRAADLAFRVEEAGELLALQGRRPARPDLAALVRRAEGWGAGLRLTAETPDGYGAVEDYLVREVLAGQPPQVRDFLLRTSVPDRVCGELADALTGQRYGHQTLERLERANVFVERIGPGRWFRYHQMFRAALRHQLALTHPETVPRLNLLAAQWYAGKGNGLTALNHAAAAEDWDFVARLVVERGLQLFASVDRADLIEVLRRIPADRFTDTAELAVSGAMLAYAEGDLDVIPQRLTRARSLLAGRDPAYRAGSDLALTVMECGAVLRRHGEMSRLTTVSSEMLDELAALRWDQVPARLQYRAIALSNKGTGLLWTGRLDHAERYLWAAASGARAAGVPLVEISAFAHLSLLAFVQGSLNGALEHVTAATDVARRIDAQHRPAVALAYLTESLIESERGRESEAEAALRRGLHALGDNPEATLAIVAVLVRARLLLDRGEPLAARSVLRRAGDEAGPRLTAPLLDRLRWLGIAETDLALSAPDAVIARYANRPALPALLPAEQVCLARAYLGAGRESAAESLLTRVRESPDRVSAVSAWILTALAADAHGRASRAGEALTRALADAEPELIRRPFRSFDAARVTVLAERQQWLTELRRPGGEGVLEEITGELPVLGAAAHTAGPLSEREMEVLQYLPTVLTAAEIAENLGISVNTVKAHMRSIYRKLGAGRRREAVVQSRQLGLL